MIAKLSAAELGLPERVPCPFCGECDTELHSAFGSQLSVATYWCRRCATAFDAFRGAAAEGMAPAADAPNEPARPPTAAAAGTPPPVRAKSSGGA